MATLEKIIEQIIALTPAELKQVRQVVEELLQSLQPRVTEDEVERKLIAEGVIAPVKMNDSEGYDFHSYKLIKVGGQPLSEILIEERR